MTSGHERPLPGPAGGDAPDDHVESLSAQGSFAPGPVPMPDWSDEDFPAFPELPEGPTAIAAQWAGVVAALEQHLTPHERATAHAIIHGAIAKLAAQQGET